MTCNWCHEAIHPTDLVYRMGNGPPLHKACMLRQVLGSVAHLEGRCSCFVRGATEGDPPALTTREVAEAALRVYLRLCTRD